MNILSKFIRIHSLELCVIVLVTIIAFGITACNDNPGTDAGSKAPEDTSVAERWGKWVADDSTATLNYSVAADGVCTITVGGTADLFWKANAGYNYTVKENTPYIYEFEAWTQSGERNLNVEYYWDDDTQLTLNNTIMITNERETHKIKGNVIPKSGVKSLAFRCADKLGTFYVKVISITETEAAETKTTTPESWLVSERWSSGSNSSSTATINDYSVSADGVCSITVGGVPANDWDVQTRYAYTAKKNTAYEYIFEVWANSDNSRVSLKYYYDDKDDGIYYGSNPQLPNKLTTYTITVYGMVTPDSGVVSMVFHWGDQTGTFSVKILSIREIKTLAIQGIPQDQMNEFSNGFIGLFPTGTTLQQALQAAENYYQTGSTTAVAGSELSAAYTKNTTTAYFPLFNTNTGNPWNGSGSYMIGMLVESSSSYSQKMFWTGPVNFSSATTTLTYNPAWEVTP